MCNCRRWARIEARRRRNPLQRHWVGATNCPQNGHEQNIEKMLPKSEMSGSRRRWRRGWIEEWVGSDERKKINRPKRETIRRTDPDKVTTHSNEQWEANRAGVKGKSSAGRSDGYASRVTKNKEHGQVSPNLTRLILSSFHCSSRYSTELQGEGAQCKDGWNNCRIFTVTIEQRQHSHRPFRLWFPSAQLSSVFSAHDRSSGRTTDFSGENPQSVENDIFSACSSDRLASTDTSLLSCPPSQSTNATTQHSNIDRRGETMSDGTDECSTSIIANSFDGDRIDIHYNSMSILQTSRLSRSHCSDVCRTIGENATVSNRSNQQTAATSRTFFFFSARFLFSLWSLFVQINHRSVKMAKQMMTIDETIPTTNVSQNWTAGLVPLDEKCSTLFTIVPVSFRWSLNNCFLLFTSIISQRSTTPPPHIWSLIPSTRRLVLFVR